MRAKGVVGVLLSTRARYGKKALEPHQGHGVWEAEIQQIKAMCTSPGPHTQRAKCGWQGTNGASFWKRQGSLLHRWLGFQALLSANQHHLKPLSLHSYYQDIPTFHLLLSMLIVSEGGVLP